MQLGRACLETGPPDRLAGSDGNKIKAAMGGVLLGFATVDISTRVNILTVWLTSVQGATSVVHTNAVTFDLDDDTTPGRALVMVCDRYVVLTDRTPREHPVLVGWGVEPSDLAMLTKQTTAGGPLQETAYAKAWRTARQVALTPAEAASPLVRRPYNLRHACASLMLNAGCPGH